MKMFSYNISIVLFTYIFAYGSLPPTPPAYSPQPQPAPVHKLKSEQLQTKYINLMILFDEGGQQSWLSKLISEEKNTGDAMTKDLEYGIRFQLPMIISVSIIKAILKAEEVASNDEKIMYDSAISNFVSKKEYFTALINKLKNEWTVNINNTNDFIVLLPKKQLEGESLTTLGFSTNNFSNFWNKVQAPYSFDPNKTEINIHNFIALFDSNASIKKRIFLSGHGGSEVAGFRSVIAQIDSKSYATLLNAFNNLNVDFLLIATCYGGGSNLEKMHQQQVDLNNTLFSTTTLKFILAIAATTDEESTFRTENLDKFFKDLDNYFTHQDLDYLKKSFSTMSDRSSIPSIRFPGTNSFFRALEINKNIKLVTVTNLKAYEFKFKQQGKESIPLELDASVAILVYPGLIAVPLNINKLAGNFHVRFTSMINGNALHIFNEIIASNIDFSLVINKFVQPTTSLNKVFFIKKLLCKDGIFENVAIEASKDKTAKVIFKLNESRFWTREVGTYREIIGFSGTIGKTISEAEAQKAISILVKEAMPSELSLYQATGGQQTREMLEKSITKALSQLPESTQQITMETIQKYKQGAPIEINLETKEAELYPAYLPITLKFINVKPTLFNPQVFQIISGIEGNALHILNEVITDTSSSEIMNAFIQKSGPIKTFLIKKLTCTDGIFENVILEASKYNNAKIIFKVISWSLYPTFNGKYVQTQGLPHAWGDIEYGMVKPKDKIDSGLIIQILKEALPAPQALSKATTGQQTLETLQKEINEAIARM